jgi:hypothetical protein
MKSREFTINVPISISINGDNDPVVNVSDKNDKLQQNPVMVSPLQQELELEKASLGKQSPVINKILQSDNIGSEENKQEDQTLSQFKNLLQRYLSLNK